ncbi:MAG: hypothetical protein ACSHX9_12585 [Luteolibacter sp.]
MFRTAAVILLIQTACQAGDPVIDLRLLRTDPKTARFLENALSDSEVDSTQIEDKLDALVKDRTLVELARFKQQDGLNGQRLNFEKDHQGIKVADGEFMPGGISIEAEPYAGNSGLVDLRFSFSRSVEEARNRIETERTMTSVTVRGDRWEILSDWGNEIQTTLLLARFSGVPAKEEATIGRLSEVRYQCEIRWCEPSDLKTFERSTPETRDKAITWLIGKSKPIATSGLRMRGGQRSSQENILEWIHDDNGWDTKQLGWSLDFQSTIGPHGKLLDFQLISNWHPRDAKKTPSKPDFAYDFATTTESGSTLVIEPKTRPSMGAVPVIFITPTILILSDPNEPAYKSKLPDEGKLGTVIYVVHPALIRKLAEITHFDPHANPPIIAQPLLKDMLQNMGLMFPAGTRASYNASECKVILTHDLKGHLLFKSILDQNDLSLPQEDKADQ